jgi:hypothetical protein
MPALCRDRIAAGIGVSMYSEWGRDPISAPPERHE